MALLTDQTLATGVTLNDLIHIVIPTDISQNPAGSSYKATVQQLFDSLSGNCISDFYVSNIHSCSPLNINPLDEGNVYFGSTSGVTIDVINNRFGVGTSSPQYPLHIIGLNSLLYYDPTSAGGRVYLSGNTGLPRYDAGISPYLTKPATAGSYGIRTWDDTLSPGYGKNGDMFLYAGIEANGLVIINQGPGTDTEDYIRFYAGQDADGNISDIHIQGTGTTRGYVGVGTETPLAKLHVDGDSIINNGLTAATLNISSTPTTDTDLPVEYLTRDSATGEVKIVQIPGPTVYGLFAQTGNSVVVSATTVESTIIDGGIGSLNVPANGFSISDSFRADFGGLLSSKNNDTITIRVKSGSVVLADSGAQTLQASTDDVWQFSVNFTVRQVGTAGVAEIVTLGVFHTTKQSNNTQTGFAFNFINNTTFDTTTPNTLDVTAQFSSNSPLNSIYSDIFVLNKIF
jgi:hypothetical protein